MATLDDVKRLLPDAKPYGRYLAVSCLWHDDEHPSLLIFSDGFNCKGCGKHGTLNELLDRLTHFTDVRPKSGFGKKGDFRNPFSRWLQQKSIPEFVADAHQVMKKFPDKAHYLKIRKIDHLISDLKLGWWEGWYIFPVFDEWGEIVNAIARANQSIQNEKGIRYMIPNGSNPMLYVPDWKQVKRSEYLYVVYGIIDAITLHSIGLPAVTGINGKFDNPDLLARFRKPIIVVPDFGEELDAIKLAGNLSWRGSVKRLQYPDGTKDCNDLFMQYGSQQLMSALA